MRRHPFAAALLLSLLLSPGQASAQTRDSLLNGALIGGAIGAGIGVGFTHAVRDSDLTFGQYAYGGLVFGAIGAGAGLGVDALLNRSPRPVTSRSLLVVPAVGRVTGVAVVWRWGTSLPPPSPQTGAARRDRTSFADRSGRRRLSSGDPIIASTACSEASNVTPDRSVMS